MAQNWHKLTENRSTFLINQQLRTGKYQNHNGTGYYSSLCEQISAVRIWAHWGKMGGTEVAQRFLPPKRPFLVKKQPDFYQT